MKKDRLSRCIGEVNDKYLEEAERYHRSKRRLRVGLLAAAACLCLIMVVAVSQLWISAPPSEGDSHLSYPDYSVTPQDKGNENSSHSAGADIPSDDNYAIYIPAIELPETTGNTDNIETDMIALIVYQGSIYTQAEWYYGADAVDVETLVGDYLGYAVGNINEWSMQDEYATEFASTSFGKVYSVNGYDKDFRICIVGISEDGEGNTTQFVHFFENLNGIGLTYGKDFFGERLDMKNNWSYVEYQEHSNWDEGWPDYIYHDLEVTNDVIDDFIDNLYSAEFEYMFETNPDFYSSSGKQAHLFFHMGDNTVVELRLFEGGYVGYRHLGWCFAKIPDEVFNLIFAACQ